MRRQRSAGAGVKSCAIVRVSIDDGTAVFEATAIAARGVSCSTARELAGTVGRHVLLAADPPGGKYDACTPASPHLHRDGFPRRGYSTTRRPYSLTERRTCVGKHLVRWRELDFDYR